jgi:hypothetical protein
LFDRDPTLPALVLLGLDSPLGAGPKRDVLSGAAGPRARAGHAVAAMLFSRPGLTLTGTESGRDHGQDIYTPYWEHGHGRKAGPSYWSRIPLPLAPGLLAMRPFAALCRTRSAAGRKHGRALAQQIGGLVEEALIDAALRGEPGESGETAAFDPGWLVHNCGEPGDSGAGERLASTASALHRLGCELNPVTGADNVAEVHGDLGAARGALMLAEALMCVAQLQKPVLVVEFDGEDGIGVGLARPLDEDTAEADR